MGLTARREARTDDTDPVYAAVRMSDKQKSLLRRCSYRDEPTFISRVIRIIERLGERIQKDRLRFFE